MQPAEFNRDKVIQALYMSPDVSAAIEKMEPEHLREEMRQEMFTVLCAMDEQRLKDLHASGQITMYLYGVLYRMVKTDRSTFYNTHRRFSEAILRTSLYVEIDGSISDSQLITEHIEDGGELVTEIRSERIRDAFNELDKYEADMFRLYMQMGKSCRPVAEATGIPVRSVRYVVNEARTKLQKSLRND